MLKRARASPGMRLTAWIADVDRGEFQVRRLELRLPASSGSASARPSARRGRAPDWRRAADRRHGPDVPWTTQHAVERAAPADLDRSPIASPVARLAQDAMVECLAARGRPCQQLDGAVDGDALLVAGDQERDRAFGLAAMRRRDGRAPPRPRRRSRPSCRRRRGRTETVRHVAGERRRGVHAPSSPGGTTSVWPAKGRCGARCRCAHRDCRYRRCRARRR